MKRLILGLILVLCLNLGAISFYPGSGEEVDVPDRAFHFKYHNLRDDLHFYGAQDWAVFFDFANYFYPAHPNLSFRMDALKLWFPQTGGEVQIRILADGNGQPALPELASFTLDVDANSLHIPLSESITAEKVWMLVEYHTNFSSRFVAASQTGGSHSYFLNTSMGTPYYQSLSSAGFDAELLFGVEGDFVDLDLCRLLNLKLDGMAAPGQTLYPSFRIYNYSDAPISQARVVIAQKIPGSNDDTIREIVIPQVIAPFSEYVWSHNSSGYHDYGFQLTDQPMQFRLRGKLSSGSVDYNTLDSYYYVFGETPRLFLTENFFRSDNAPSLLALENQVLSTDEFRDIQNLCYFPVLGDSLAMPGARLRFDWYGFNSMPIVVLGGTRRILGMDSGFLNRFRLQSDSLLTQKTFISTASASADIEPEGLQVRFSFANNSTAFLDIANVYDLVANCRFFAGLFQKLRIGNVDSWVFVKWIEHNLPLGGGLNMGDRLNIDSEMALTGLDPLAEYRVYYWIQERGGGKVFTVDFFGLELPVSNADYVTPAAGLSISPNPLRGEKSVTIRFDMKSGAKPSRMKVFNLRGQLIFEDTLERDTKQLPGSLFPSSGIYLIRIESSGLAPKTAKISIIK